MPQLTLPASAEGLPLTRRDIEQHVDALIDLLDILDADPDAEPSLGFTESHYNPDQDCPDYSANANAGDDREEEDEREPSEDGEPSLGWTDNLNQGCAAFHGNNFYGDDAEDGVGPVRKKRPPSKTGGSVYRGTAVLGLKEPPRNPRTFTLPMARPKRRAGR